MSVLEALKRASADLDIENIAMPYLAEPDSRAADAALLRELAEALSNLDWGVDDEVVVAYEFVGGLERLRRLVEEDE